MAVSDVNMSSEGSGTSRLRQFGLYKTIDSQTEEFLKLSRRRQIRRGCACAAVSTAITVTVVVTALLVYEYGFRTDFKTAPNALRKFDFNAVNDSKVTFDKNTPVTKTAMTNNAKLVAIILKALDQKRYLEAVVEEHSSVKSQYEKTTDYPFQKNVFADRNRKMPSKVYEKYKPKPQRYFKNRRRDSYMKARKIMDYQRVMTYLNTMSLGKKTDETTTDISGISSTSKPNFTGKITPIDYKSDIFQEYNYQMTDAETRKESDNRYCTCPPRSKLTDLLNKLYVSIQELHPKAIESTTDSNTKCEKHKPKKHKTVEKQKSKNTTTLTPKLNSTMSTQNPISEPTETTTVEYKTTIYDSNSSYTRELFPWKLDSGITVYDEIPNVYIHTEHANVKSTSEHTIGITESNEQAEDTGFKSTSERTKVVISSNEQTDVTNIKSTRQNKGIKNSNDQLGFDDKPDNLPPIPGRYPNPQSENAVKETHEIKRTTSADHSYFSNYIDSLSKMYKKTLIVNKPQPGSSMVHSLPSENPLDMKQISLGLIEPVKLLFPSTEIPRDFKPIEGKTQQKIRLSPTYPEEAVVERKNKIDSGLLKKPKHIKLRVKSKPAENNHDEKAALAPMFQSYLLSKKDSGILNLAAETTPHNSKGTSTETDDLPFNLNFPPNEEDERVTILKDDSTTVTIHAKERRENNKDESEVKTSTEQVNVLNAGKKEIVLPLTQTWEPMYLSNKKHLETTGAPIKNSEPKKSKKIKEIFYMTGGHTPVDDFDENLSSLMYFDRNPVNYTALANAFLNKMESDSIETSKSMMPESRPPHLEIRRNHEGLNLHMTNLYSSDEQIL